MVGGLEGDPGEIYSSPAGMTSNLKVERSFWSLRSILWEQEKCGKFVNAFVEEESGQGISEYGAIIAFVALLVAITFSAGNGSLMPAVSKAFKEISSQVNALSSTAASAS